MTTTTTPAGDAPEAKTTQDENAPLPPIATQPQAAQPPAVAPEQSTALARVEYSPDAFRMMLEPQTF